MVYRGKVVALTTGKDVAKMKDTLYRGYFHLPDPNKKKRRRRA